MNKKYIVYILILFLVGILSAGGTYAYFEVKSNPKAVSTSSKKFEVIYNGGQSITGPILLVKSKEDGLKTTVNISVAKDSVEALGTIYINIDSMSPELATNGFNWEVIGEKNGRQVFTNNGTFEGFNDTTNNLVNIVPDYKITEEVTSFTIYLWLDGNKFGNEVINKNFKGYIGAKTENFTAAVSK